MHEGIALPLEQTYCQRILDERLPTVIPDVRGDDRAASLPVTEAAGVGAFVSVPITFLTASSTAPCAQPATRLSPRSAIATCSSCTSPHGWSPIRSSASTSGRRARPRAQATAAGTLIAALHARDGYTAAHSESVVSLAGAVAQRLGLDAPEAARVRLAALLHDVGKIAVPDAILGKPGRLTAEEWEIMRAHPISSERIVGDAPGLESPGPILRAQHERWEGAGYPDGLAGEAIPLASRITSSATPTTR